MQYLRGKGFRNRSKTMAMITGNAPESEKGRCIVHVVLKPSSLLQRAPNQQKMRTLTVGVQKSFPRQISAQLFQVLSEFSFDFGSIEFFDSSDTEVRQFTLFHPRGMKGVENIGAVVTSHVENREWASGMRLDPFAQVINATFIHNPAIVVSRVLTHLIHREVALCSRRSKVAFSRLGCHP